NFNMKFFKHISKYIIILTLCVSILFMNGCNKMEAIKTKSRQKYTLHFKSDLFKNKMSADVYFDEEDIISPCEDKENALLSAVLCESSYQKETISKNLSTLGFTNIKCFNYGENKENTANFAVGLKGNLLAVIIRGSAENEWNSNFDIGKEATHRGFQKATAGVTSDLLSYIKNLPENNSSYKFYFAGHSRGGAIANLIAKNFIDTYGKENVVAYTFSSPNTTTSKESKSYGHIYNFVYTDDFISQCPLAKWGYTKYGKIITLSTLDSEMMNARKNFRLFTDTEFKTFKDENKDINDFLSCAERLAPTVDDYYNKLFAVDEEKISLYDYFGLISEILSGKNSYETGITLYCTLLSEAEDITRFLITGIDINTLLKEHSLKGSCVMYAHTCITYISYLYSR
ncbi:MAG: hypothetical protein ACI4QE_01315, partial [Acutalibacteraceae bacterium]